MDKLIPVIIWNGENAVLLGKTLMSVDYFPTVYLYTSKEYGDLHKILTGNFLKNTDLQVFTTKKYNPRKMKNRAIQDIIQDHPGSYLMFLEAGDTVLGSPDITDELIGDDPVFYCDDVNEFGPLWKITEDSLPSTTFGIILNPKFLVDNKLEFTGNSDIEFLISLYRVLPEHIYTVGMDLESGRERDYIGEIRELLRVIEENTDDPMYYELRHTLTHVILDGISAGTAGIEAYFAYAYPEKSI